MSTSLLRRVHIQHPWLVGMIGTTPVYIRAQHDDDCSGFTDTEAEDLFSGLILPNFDTVMANGITRYPNTFRPDDERDICICLIGKQLQAFFETPTVTIVTYERTLDGIDRRPH